MESSNVAITLSYRDFYDRTPVFSEMVRKAKKVNRRQLLLCSCWLNAYAEEFKKNTNSDNIPVNTYLDFYKLLFPTKLVDKALAITLDYLPQGFLPIATHTTVALARVAHFFSSENGGKNFNYPCDCGLVSDIILMIQAMLFDQEILDHFDINSLSSSTMRQLNAHYYFLNQQFPAGHDLTRMYIFENVDEVSKKLRKITDEPFSKWFMGRFLTHPGTYRFIAGLYSNMGRDFTLQEPDLPKLVVNRDNFVKNLVDESREEFNKYFDLVISDQKESSKHFGSKPKSFADLLWGKSWLYVRPVFRCRGSTIILSREAVSRKFVHNFTYLFPEILSIQKPELSRSKRTKAIKNFGSEIGQLFEGYVDWLLKNIFRNSLQIIPNWYTKIDSNYYEQDALIVNGTTAIVVESKYILPTLEEVENLSGESLNNLYGDILRQMNRGAKAALENNVYDENRNPLNVKIERVIPVGVLVEDVLVSILTYKSFTKVFSDIIGRNLFEGSDRIAPFQFIPTYDLERLTNLKNTRSIAEYVFGLLEIRASDEQKINRSIMELIQEEEMEEVGFFDKWSSEAFSDFKEKAKASFQ